MKLLKKRWFYFLVLLLIVLIYLALVSLGVLPTYQCGTTLGPNGPIEWCGWYRGTVVG